MRELYLVNATHAALPMPPKQKSPKKNKTKKGVYMLGVSSDISTMKEGFSFFETWC